MKSNNHSQQNFRRDGFLGLTGRKVNLLDRYEKKLEDLEDNLRKEQNLLAGEVRGISSQYLNLIIIWDIQMVLVIFMWRIVST